MRPIAWLAGGWREAWLAGGWRDAADCVSGRRLPGCGRLRVWREAAGRLASREAAVMRPTARLA